MSTLTHEEHQRVVKTLGREPNEVELGIFSVMWSEHCCYKSSKMYLKNFPTKSPRVLLGPGENAGIIDIGDGYAVAFKIESHNHPSFIEPYQGAATGVGGILRDIFTMGARPIASLNSLHFGDFDHPRTEYLLRGVVAGIGGYGNAVGVPMVGGEVHFDSCYNGNILVNAFALGVLRHDRIFKGIAAGVGNPVILVGSKTGRDGIHGATMASDVFDSESESKRPTVQVGDPFTEKKLMEACLEAFEIGGAIVGIQDMGAAGFTCSTFEMSARGGAGMELWLDKIPLRETKMTPYEIMLSESQERMLLVAEKGREEELKRVFEKWELEFAVVGKVIAEKKVVGTFHGETIFDLPVAPVTDEAPVYERPVKKPVSPSPTPLLMGEGKGEGDRKLDGLPIKEWIWRQYDYSVGTNTVMGPGGPAALIRVKENGKLLALTVNSRADLCAEDPYLGTMAAVAEGVEKLAKVGAKPLGVTNCLNFGNPENPEVMWQFKEACRGLADACKQYDIPVVSGNVSLYNETNAPTLREGQGKNIKPTPVIAIVGIVENESCAA
ncbi:MAG: phosphoribosylformylglycinamidine synthase subunit PurL [Deltaproteobacteria bacterium]|nr:phosphoribosylformylglycinamidine synthase subunit PurL [Deltaproteobacteria bacterium]MDZ4224952.1 phosphoribosylformylglycinamidine synthase subunit PurL [bacterium]